MTKATLPRREEPTHAASQRIEFRNFTILEHNFLKVEHKLRKGSSLTGKSSISCSQKTLVKSSSQHTAPCRRINCFSRVRRSTGPRFLGVKGRACRRACSPSTLRASVAFPLALISYADETRLSCRGDCRIDTESDFPFFVNSISTAHTPSRVVSRCNDFLINPISSGVHPRGDAGGGKRVGCIFDL